MRPAIVLLLAGCFDFESLETLYHSGAADLSAGDGAMSVDDLSAAADLSRSGDLSGADLRPVTASFTAQLPCLTLGTGLGTLYLAVYDANHTNGPDLVVAENGNKTVLPLSSNAAGSAFAGGTPISIPNNVNGVAGGDFDGDGTPDLVATTGANLYWMRGMSVGVYASPAPIHAGTQLGGVVGAFLDGDTHLDAAFVDGSQMKAFIGTMGAAAGFATYQSPSTSSGGGEAIAAADLDHDGDLDVVVANRSGLTVDTFINSGGTISASTSVSLGVQPAYLAVGDLNDDGAAEVAIMSSNQVMVVLMNQGDGTLSMQNGISFSPQGAEGLVIADFNRDGLGDIAYVGAVSNTLYILQGKGDGTFLPAQTYGTCAGASTIVSGDFNVDGRPDIVVGCTATSSDICLFSNTTP
jgi:FG-GAP-like repeat